MDKVEFQLKEKRAATMVMEAVEQAEALLKVNSDIGASLGLDADYAAAGAAFQAIIDTLGAPGPASNRAKLDKIRS